MDSNFCYSLSPHFPVFLIHRWSYLMEHLQFLIFLLLLFSSPGIPFCFYIIKFYASLMMQFKCYSFHRSLILKVKTTSSTFTFTTCSFIMAIAFYLLIKLFDFIKELIKSITLLRDFYPLVEYLIQLHILIVFSMVRFYKC